MEYKRFGTKIFIRCDRGEEILAKLTEVCEKENVRLASVSGIGAVGKATVGLFKVAEQKYYPATFEEEMEIASLAGDVTRKDGQVYLHIHAALGREGGSVVGGHLTEAVISATSEIVLDCADGELSRRFDESIGLNVLDF